LKQFNHSYNRIAAELGITEEEIAYRKSFLEITEDDVELLKQAYELLMPFQSKFVDMFYEHVFSFEEMHELIVRHGVSLEQLKFTQLDYFRTLTSGQYDLAYFHNRLKVGLAHERIGLDVKWYIGAYRKYLSELFDYLGKSQNHGAEQLTRLFRAITKIVSLDIGLAIDAYICSNKQTILDLEQRQNNLIQGIDGFIWEFDVVQHKYRYVSNKAELLLGYSQRQWLENPDFQQQIVFPENRGETLAAYKKAIHEGHNFTIEYRVNAADGRAVWISERVSAEKNAEGQVVLLRGLMLDIGERKHYEEQLSYLATYDELTGLPNRSLFGSHLKLALSEAKRNGTKLAIMFLDLDGFKDVNDSLGHDAGDQLLRTIGKRLADHILRGSDFVARFGGDEFCMILENKRGDFRPEHIAERCLEELGRPTLIGSSNIYPRASIGIALFPGDGDTPETLLQCADNAMYAAKALGKHRYAFYSVDMTSLAEQRLNLENDLRKAVEQGNFVLHYQPQVSLASGKMVAVEALIRWLDPVRGLVSPDDFIPVAEKIGLISAIGEWVLETACRQFMAWRKSGVSLNHIAINISGSHFCTNTLPATIAKLMTETGIRAEELEIEITEGVLQTGKGCLDCFTQLKAMGIKIAIDDFGTGYSCLNSLTQLPLDCLKIDKSFTKEVMDNKNASSIVATILAMSRVLNFSVVAEGVETVEQLQFLHGIGCDTVQGYFFSKPVDAEQIAALASSGFLPAIAE
jgi:diguanylate cyclase (GGDEF)-like protein/PAS domain S-box-containing protein